MRQGCHREPEHVRPVVVAGRVEALPFLEQPLRVELGVEDSLLVVERAGEVAAVGPRTALPPRPITS
jgi:hypothetical protein